MSTTSKPMAARLRWCSVRRPFAVAPLFVPFVLIGYMVPGLAVGLLFALVGGLGEEFDWRWALVCTGTTLIYLTWFAICARLVYAACRAKPAKQTQAAIWGGLCFGALPMPLIAIVISGIWVVANLLTGL